jgi:hypothetical protein
VPTLLVYGDQDVRAPLTVAEDLQAAIPGSALVVLPGAGHISNVEAPKRSTGQSGTFSTPGTADHLGCPPRGSSAERLSSLVPQSPGAPELGVLQDVPVQVQGGLGLAGVVGRSLSIVRIGHFRREENPDVSSGIGAGGRPVLRWARRRKRGFRAGLAG